jgi:uncharacterized membrane protein
MIKALDLASQAAVGLSLPLLLFGTDIKGIGGPALACVTSMLLGAASVAASTCLLHLAFVRTTIANVSHQIAALITAVCIGGTPNMASVRFALSIDIPTFVAVHTSEVVIGAVYVLLLLTVAKRALSACFRQYDPHRLLVCFPWLSSRGSTVQGTESAKLELTTPHSAVTPPEAIEESFAEAKDEGTPLDEESAVALGPEAFWSMTRAQHRCGLLAGLGLAVVVLGASAGIGLVAGEWGTLVTILLLTFLSVLLSLVDRVRTLPHTFTLGEYIMLCFCTVVGMMADLRALAATDPLVIAAVASMMVCAVSMHILLAWICRIDVDTFIISSVSNILSPPFVSVACAAVGNRDLMAPGITAGLLGYALGNFLGVAVGTGLQQ